MLKVLIQYVIFLIGLLMIVATLMPLLPWSAWWIRIFDFPRVQIAVIAAVAAAFYAFFGKVENSTSLVFLLILCGCTIFQLYRIFPYTPLATPRVKPNLSQDTASQFSLLVSNVLMENRQSELLLQTIRQYDPDLLLAVETDQWWLDQLQTLSERYPYKVTYPLANTYGMVLFSRLELIEPKVNFLIQDDVPSIYTRFVLPAGVTIDLYGLHPRPPSPTEHYRSTERDAEILVVGKAVKATERPAVVAGDLNDVAWSSTNYLFQRISGLLDPRIGRGIFGTFHAKYPFLRWPLDHVFHSAELRLVDMKTLSYFGSDHLPIYIKLSYEPQRARAQDKPEAADQDDKEEARETITEAIEDNK